MYVTLLLIVFQILVHLLSSILVLHLIINCLSDSNSSVEFHSGSPFNSIPEETGKDIQEGLYRRGLFYPQTFTRLKLCLALNGFLL